MPEKSKLSNDFIARMKRFANAGITESPSPTRHISKLDELPTLEGRIEKILGIANQSNKGAGNMLFFVMYDIESNKVRNQVVKYLQRQGCSRIQKSIFLANLSTEKYNAIRCDLTEVQAAYDNNDSILVVPISTDLLQAMKIIGQSLDVDVITKTKSTLFF